MHFTTTFIATIAALLTTGAAADGLFAISGSGTVGSDGSPPVVFLRVDNGLVGEIPKCSGTVETAPLPASGLIPCDQGYSLTFKWDTKTGDIAATYGTPSSPPFTYNVPNNGCVGDTCTFGFQDLFPGKKMRRGLRA